MLRLDRASAKLNLVLELTGCREDGYHELAAVSQTIGWSDVVGVEAGPNRPEGCRLVVAGPHSAAVPHGEENILMRVLGLLRSAGRAQSISRVVLEKRIPTRSGLGGGSADAAALLRLAAGGSPDQELLQIALQCGADVPFAIAGGAARVAGVGEVLSPLPSMTSGVFLVAMLGEVSTAAAYAAVAPEDFSNGDRSATVARSLATGTHPDRDQLGSALLPAALRVSPGLAERLETLRRATPGVRWAMTGSGGAFFALFDGAAEAARSAGAIARSCPGVSVRAALPEPGWAART